MGWLSAIVAVTSAYYQSDQQRKAKNAAEEKQKAAEEARKGFEFTTEGEVSPIPLVYGKALVGGVRAWHGVSNNYKYVASTCDKTLLSGHDGAPAGSYTGKVWVGGDSGDWVDQTTNFSATPSSYLTRDIIGSKNEFLFFQQAICIGPIQAVHDVVIDEGMYIDNPLLGTYPTGDYVTDAATSALDMPIKAATLIEMYYGSNNSASALVSANFGGRASSKFTDLAYASAVFRMDRDTDRVFSGVPKLQFLIEGRKVRTVSSLGVLSSTRTYSNNPAWCLLDYLLDDIVGRGLDTSQVDLASFYKASLVCDTTVMSNAPVGGKLYQPTDDSRNVSTRNVPLYECNIAINSTKSIRDNVEAMLTTMGDARLVWSRGQYKLLLQYPASNAAIELADTLSDSDIVNSSIQMTWPGTDSRLNYCTIRFHNEVEGFKEDSVSWPPKTNGVYFKGIGGIRYTTRSGWVDTTPGYEFLNQYAVWDGAITTTSLRYCVMPKITGTYTLKLCADNSANLSVNGSSVLSSGTDLAVHSTTVSLTKDTPITITISGTDTGGIEGIAANLVGSDGAMLWSTRDEAFGSYLLKTESNTVYTTYKTEDGELELEQDNFIDGITDYYHALAKAEETVRISRSATTMIFECLLKNKLYEPGDIIKLNSTTLDISGEFFLKVNEVKVKEGGIAEISGIRFDYHQLAWNVDDADAGTVPPVESYGLPVPQSFTYVTPAVESDKGGKLTWVTVSDNRVLGYILYFHESGKLGTDGRPIFDEIGRSTSGPFVIDGLSRKAGIFGIRSYSASMQSPMATTSVTTVVQIGSGLTPPTPTGLAVVANSRSLNSVELTWVIPATRVDGSAYLDHGYTAIYYNNSDNLTTAMLLDSSYSNTKRISVQGNGTYYFWVKLISKSAKAGAASNSLSVAFDPTVTQLLSLLHGAITEDAFYASLGARINLIDGNGVNSVNSRIQVVQADADYAVDLVTQVNSTVGGMSTTVQEHTSSINGINGSYSVKIDNNGYVTGFGLVSDPNNGTPVSRFYVRADSFAVGSGTNVNTTGGLDEPSVDNIPFVVRTSAAVVNGITIPAGVYMKSAFIETVTANRIDSRGLSIKDDSGNVIFASGNGLTLKQRIPGSGNMATIDQINSSNASTYIASLAVDNLQIANNAITVPIFFNGAGGFSVSGDYTVVTTGSYYYQSTATVMVDINWRTICYTYGADSSVQLYVDGSYVFYSADTAISNAQSSHSAKTKLTLSPGWHTFQLHMGLAAGAAYTAGEWAISILGVMK